MTDEEKLKHPTMPILNYFDEYLPNFFAAVSLLIHSPTEIMMMTSDSDGAASGESNPSLAVGVDVSKLFNPLHFCCCCCCLLLHVNFAHPQKLDLSKIHKSHLDYHWHFPKPSGHRDSGTPGRSNKYLPELFQETIWSSPSLLIPTHHGYLRIISGCA